MKTLAVVTALTMAAMVAITAQAQTPARWETRSVQFHYSGFTADYSCDGLEDKLRHLLRRIGARDDLEVRTTACAHGMGRPEPFVNALVTFAIPVALEGDGAGDLVADWQNVRLDTRHPVRLDRGDCELMEQFRDQILPLLSHRIVSERLDCVPGQLRIAPGLEISVLIARAAG